MTSSLNTIDLAVGRIANEYRVQRELTLSFVASKLGTSIEELRAKEAGERRFSAADLQILCRLLSLKPSDLYQGVTIEAVP